MTLEKAHPPTLGHQPINVTDPGQYVPQPTDIVPTGHCFDDAWQLVMSVVPVRYLSTDTFRVVHAVCRGSDGTEYAHAWVEEYGQHVGAWIDGARSAIPGSPSVGWQGGIHLGKRVYYAIEVDAMHRMLEAGQMVRYSPQDMVHAAQRFGHTGPWDLIGPYAIGGGRIMGVARRGTDARVRSIIWVEPVAP